MTEPARYTKKPVTIDAVRWDGTVLSATKIIDWVLAEGGTATYDHAHTETVPTPAADEMVQVEVPARLRITTLEGVMDCTAGNWVLRGLEGEFYPCKHSVFEASYTETGPGTPVLVTIADGLEIVGDAEVLLAQAMTDTAFERPTVMIGAELPAPGEVYREDVQDGVPGYAVGPALGHRVWSLEQIQRHLSVVAGVCVAATRLERDA